MSILQAIVLGAIQGLTELLPVSSSAHLALVPALLGWPKPSVPFAVAVHVGTAIALALYFRCDLAALMSGTARWVCGRTCRENEALENKHNARLLFLLLLATVPAAIVGPIAEDAVDALFGAPAAVGAFLFVTAVLMLISPSLSRGEEGRTEVTWKDALWIGLAQVAALPPGISRSGATIVAGLALGLRPTLAARFAFLMSIPVILGGGAFEAIGLTGQGITAMELTSYLFGAAVAGACAWAAVVLVFKAVSRGKLGYYGLYCLLAGIFAVVVGLTRDGALR